MKNLQKKLLKGINSYKVTKVTIGEKLLDEISNLEELVEQIEEKSGQKENGAILGKTLIGKLIGGIVDGVDSLLEKLIGEVEISLFGNNSLLGQLIGGIEISINSDDDSKALEMLIEEVISLDGRSEMDVESIDEDSIIGKYLSGKLNGKVNLTLTGEKVETEIVNKGRDVTLRELDQLSIKTVLNTDFIDNRILNPISQERSTVGIEENMLKRRLKYIGDLNTIQSEPYQESKM